MTKRASMYKSEKRKKELSRQKKREEKMRKRLERGETQKQNSDLITPVEGERETGQAGS